MVGLRCTMGCFALVFGELLDTWKVSLGQFNSLSSLDNFWTTVTDQVIDQGTDQVFGG